MSRSNPGENTPNPSTRWFEWHGERGVVRYYDKATKQQVEVELPFGFVLLDELASVGGWHEPSQSGIYSNEVRDTRQDVLLVKAFKGGTIAEGFYKAIKDQVAVAGGHFVATCYVGFKGADGALELGAIKFKGAALSAWMDFRKAHRASLYTQAIEIDGYTEGKKGRVVYRVPQFVLRPLSEPSHLAAVALDMQLQTYLTAYLARTKREQVDAPPPIEMPPVEHDHVTAPTDDDIPF